jgi:DNA-directed RNA polymerase specialized sigma24 family protein
MRSDFETRPVADDPAFDELVRLFEAPIGRFLAQITRDRGLAADLMPETFLVRSSPG